ncbi:MAG: hypothetical protein ACLQGP_13535 [Isosphaeraceae bacterium]
MHVDLMCNTLFLETAFHKVIEQAGQRYLRDVEEEVRVFREPDSTTHERRQPSDHSVPDRSGGERLGEGLDGSVQFFRQKPLVSSHGER